MPKRPNHADPLDPLIRDALAWVVRLKSGEATLTDAEQLIAWCTKSPAHERAFLDATRYWRAIGHTLDSDQGTGRRRRRRKTNGTSLS